MLLRKEEDRNEQDVDGGITLWRHLLCDVQLLQGALQVFDLDALVLRLGLEAVQLMLCRRLLRLVQWRATGPWQLAQTQLDAQVLYDGLAILQGGPQLLRLAACGARGERSAQRAALAPPSRCRAMRGGAAQLQLRLVVAVRRRRRVQTVLGRAGAALGIEYSLQVDQLYLLIKKSVKTMFILTMLTKV